MYPDADHDIPTRRARAALGIGALLLLFVRGVLLWLIVPVGFLIWLLTFWRGASCGQVIGWVDWNCIAAIQRTLVRPFLPSRLPWIAWRDRRDVSHRPTLLDPA